MSREIGNIHHPYGGLLVKESGGKYFWSIENQLGEHWEEIPISLFKELNKFQDSVKGEADE